MRRVSGWRRGERGIAHLSDSMNFTRFLLLTAQNHLTRRSRSRILSQNSAIAIVEGRTDKADGKLIFGPPGS